MPLYFQKKTDDASILGVWELTESIDDLEKNIPLSSEEKEGYSKISNISRKKQWLACRYLVKELYKGGTQIIYDSNGKPFLKDSAHFISMTHTENFSAIIISFNCYVGIDIEKIDPRLKRISHRMASEKELAFAGSCVEKETERLTTIWCAKEAIFKLYGLEVANFSEDIFVDIENINTKNQFKAIIKNYETVILNKINIDDHILVYVEVKK